jgi:hypothetical protein
LRLRGSWGFLTLHDSRNVAEACWLEVSSRSAFDRWRLTWHGPERRTPLLRLQCLASVWPAQTLVTIDPGVISVGTSEPEEWQAVVRSLETVLEGDR